MATAAKILGVAPASIAKICGVAKASVKSVMGVELAVATPSLIDSYSESNCDTDWLMSSTTGAPGRGQVLALASSATLTSVKFYLKKVGSPTGNMTARVYAATGTPGTDGVGTGSALASSGTIDVSTLSSSYALVEFSLSYSAAAGNYLICAFYDGGDASNKVAAGLDTSSPSHAGNGGIVTDGGGFSGYASTDVCFYLYGY
jgi:hypothetical protein